MVKANRKRTTRDNRTLDPMARDLRQPKYRPLVIPNKKKLIPRRKKNEGICNDV